MKQFDIAALGACYIDMNTSGFPFGQDGIPVNTELVGGTYEIVPGGSAVNFCRMIGTLGLTTSFIGMTGNDPLGSTLAKLLQQEGVEPYITRQQGLHTNIGFNMTNSDGDHIMCVAGTANAHLNMATIEPQLLEAVSTAKILYLGGCFKLKAFEKNFADLAAVAKEQGTALSVDHGRIPAGISESMLDSVRSLVLAADYYFPSRDEFCKLWGVDSIESGIQHLAEAASELTVVVKDGQHGAYYRHGKEARLIPAFIIEQPVDVTGAGDAFNAGVMRALLAQRPLQDAVTFGCKVAAAKISRAEVPALE